MTLSEKAYQYAKQKHEETNHLYDGKPYLDTHLIMVSGAASDFITYIPEADRETVLAALWCHDLIEDCRVTYNDLKKQTSEEVADIVYAVTNEKGKNRHERANEKYYEGIRSTKYATFVKLCDRIANYKYSLHNGPEGMFIKYEQEMPNFISSLLCDFKKQEWNEIYINVKVAAYLSHITENEIVA